MIKKATLLLFFILMALSLSACQKTQIIQNSCPGPKLEKKIVKNKIFNMNKDLERLLAKTKNLEQYEMKNETNL